MGFLVRVRADLEEGFVGWYGSQRRRRGEVFEIEKEEHFSGERILDDGTPNGIKFKGWMEWVEAPKPVVEPDPVVEAVRHPEIESSLPEPALLAPSEETDEL